MTETFKSYKPLEHIFLLTEDVIQPDFTTKAQPAENNETAVHKIALRDTKIRSSRPWIY
ncbi:MAG TPA: hypothetical protein VL625_05255 [Patescibacteria group bacterium]|nr:hypothetical protein [Patescibacteria group bacterium]